MGAIDDAPMLTDNQTLRSDNDTIRIDPKAHRPIGKGRRNAVAVALQMHEAGWGDPFGVFDKPVEETGRWHESLGFLSPDIVRFGDSPDMRIRTLTGATLPYQLPY